MNQIVNMILRMVMNKLVNRGMNAGINRALGPRTARGAQSPAEKAEAAAARTTTKRAKSAIKVARKLGRF